MKKFIFLGLSALALVGCSSRISDSNQLVGSWRCTIHYDDINISSIDNFTFLANGAVTNQGTINYPIQKPIFVYSVQNSGRWNLNEGRIIYRILKEKVQRNHSSAILTELQKEADLKQYEESLFNTLSESEYNKTIELEITDFSVDEMDIKQELKGLNAYKGQCVKQ